MNKVCDLESIPSEKSEFGVWGGTQRKTHKRFCKRRGTRERSLINHRLNLAKSLPEEEQPCQYLLASVCHLTDVEEIYVLLIQQLDCGSVCAAIGETKTP